MACCRTYEGDTQGWVAIIGRLSHLNIGEVNLWLESDEAHGEVRLIERMSNDWFHNRPVTLLFSDVPTGVAFRMRFT